MSFEPLLSLALARHGSTDNKISWMDTYGLCQPLTECGINSATNAGVVEIRMRRDYGLTTTNLASVIQMSETYSIEPPKPIGDCLVPRSNIIKSIKNHDALQSFCIDVMVNPQLRNAVNHGRMRKAIPVPSEVFSTPCLIVQDQHTRIWKLAPAFSSHDQTIDLDKILYEFISSKSEFSQFDGIQHAHLSHITQYSCSPKMYENDKAYCYLILTNSYGSLFLSELCGGNPLEATGFKLLRCVGPGIEEQAKPTYPSSIEWLEISPDLTMAVGYIDGRAEIVTLDRQGGEIVVKESQYVIEEVDYRQVDHIKFCQQSSLVALGKHTTVVVKSVKSPFERVLEFPETKYDLTDVAIYGETVAVSSIDKSVIIHDLKKSTRRTLNKPSEPAGGQALSISVSPSSSLLAVLTRIKIKDIYLNLNHTQVTLYGIKSVGEILDKHWISSPSPPSAVHSLPIDDLIIIYAGYIKKELPDRISNHLNDQSEWSSLSLHKLRLILALIRLDVEISPYYSDKTVKTSRLEAIRLLIVQKHIAEQGHATPETLLLTTLCTLNNSEVVTSHSCQICMKTLCIRKDIFYSCEDGHRFGVCYQSYLPLAFVNPVHQRQCVECDCIVNDDPLIPKREARSFNFRTNFKTPRLLLAARR